MTDDVSNTSTNGAHGPVWPSGFEPANGPRLITPELAQVWMGRNAPFNRPIRIPRVQYFADLLRTKLMHPTGDAVTFDVDDWMTNGQHRLSAIILSGIAHELDVKIGLPKESYPVQDRNRVRTVRDGTGRSNSLLADVVLCHRFIFGPDTKQIPEQVQSDMAEWWEPTHNLVFGRGHSSKVGSSAIRIGAGLRWAAEPDPMVRDKILAQISALMSSDAPAMSRSTGVLWKWLNRADTAGSLPVRIQRACRVYHFFDPKKAAVAPLLKDQEGVFEEMSNLLAMMESAYLLAQPGGHPYDFAAALKLRRRMPFGPLPGVTPVAGAKASTAKPQPRRQQPTTNR